MSLNIKTKKERRRAKNLCEMFRFGKSTRGVSKSTYLDPDEFSLAWVNDMENLINGKLTKLLKNGRLVDEEDHEFYYADSKVAEQMWSTKSYQVICFYRHLRSSYPELLKSPRAKGILEIWEELFEKGKGAHCAHTCSNKKCVRHVRLASRKQNEIDKHWMFFLEHPIYGARFREFALSDPDMANEAKTYLNNGNSSSNSVC